MNNAAGTVRTTNMESSLKHLEEQVEIAGKKLASLKDTLQGLVRPQPKDSPKLDAKPEESFAPIPHRIRDLANRLQFINGELQVLTSNLEV